MNPSSLLILTGAGLIAGILAGFLGIGGGTVLVPLLLALGNTPVQSVATSSLSIVITAISGSVQNWRMGLFSFKRVIGLGFPAIITAQVGAEIASRIYPYYLLGAFGLLLLLNIYLVELRKRLTAKKKPEGLTDTSSVQESVGTTDNLTPIPASRNLFFNPTVARITTGGTAGILAGLFGVGGGVIMVPLQILLLEETIKTAIQTSLGVIVITAVSACVGHALRGNVLWVDGLILGFGGFIGAQISTRFLPRLPDEVVSLAFRTFLAILSVYIFWQAWQSYIRNG
jgi:uncharacterized membrane protein YfcA